MKLEALKLYLCPLLTYRQKLILIRELLETKTELKEKRIRDLLELSPGKSRILYQVLSDPQLRKKAEYLNSQYNIVTIIEDAYPKQLREIYRPPLVLFYEGRLELLSTQILAIVGSRNATKYGRQALDQIMPGLAYKNITICSGLARGIDSIAHRHTLGLNGNAVAVIGTGIDKVYPRENKSLQQLVAKKGLVLTEYLPGESPLAWHFPQRNRIIAGLSKAVLVIEAKERSGSLITANIALQENRSVMAVPGPIDSLNYVGCNKLIAAGAKPVLTASDVVNEFSDLTI